MDRSRAQQQQQRWLVLFVLSVLLCRGASGARVMMQIQRKEVAAEVAEEAVAEENEDLCIKLQSSQSELYDQTCNSLKPESVKVETYITPALKFQAGDVKDKYFHMPEAPRGHIGLRSVTAEMVDECGVSIPHHEFHFHHWFGFQFAVPKRLHSPRHTQQLLRSLITEGGKMHYSAISTRSQRRSSSRRYSSSLYDLVDTPAESKLITAFGKGGGASSRDTSAAGRTGLPSPFGLEMGAPSQIPEAHEIVWIVNVHGIDTRGVVDRIGCIECRCDLYNATTNERGEPLPKGYLGGLSCCGDDTHCLVQEGFNAPERNLYMKTSWEYVDWDECVVPTETLYIDITNKNGFGENSVEFTIDGCNATDPNSKECIDVRDATLLAPIGGQVVSVESHLHSSVVDSILRGEDGRIICHPSIIYGTDDADVNELDVTTIVPCYPSMGSLGREITQGERLHYQVKYSKIDGPHTGVMGLVTLNIAKKGASTTI